MTFELHETGEIDKGLKQKIKVIQVMKFFIKGTSNYRSKLMRLTRTRAIIQNLRLSTTVFLIGIGRISESGDLNELGLGWRIIMVRSRFFRFKDKRCDLTQVSMLKSTCGRSVFQYL